MEKKGLKVFEDALKADEALRQKFEEALKNVTGVSSDGEALQKAAAELGYEISLEELEQAWVAAQELDETELASVAGGGPAENNWRDDWCALNWFCYTLAHHEEVVGEHYEACWSDYYCSIVYHH